ncbi:MAG: hypothetical protein ACLTWG_08035 [Blautia sp.]|uniref:hypothetical protein n=1 Tax=Blautia sp. TaxID=1955243 RepID=UPI003994DC0B
MRRKYLAFLLAGCMSLSFPTAAWGAVESEDPAQTETSLDTSGETEGNPHAELGTDIYGYQVEYAGNLIQLPMTYDDFTAMGWTLSKNDSPDTMISTGSYGMATFNNGEVSAYVDMINFGINEAPLSDCLVGGIKLDLAWGDIDLSSLTVKLPGGIVMGTSNIEDIKAAYGEPSDTYEGDLYTKMTYQQDSYQRAELYVYKEENTLLQVDLRNFKEPEDFDKGSVSTEIPDIVSNYKAPAALGSDFMDPDVEFMGSLYRLPAPVSAFLDNGWVMKDVAEDAFLEGGGLEFIEMMKENQTARFSVYNLTENATSIENCFVTELSFGSYDPEILALKLSEDITLGADKNELLTKASERGYLYDDKDNYLTIYPDKDSKLDHYVEFWFNEDESTTQAASITVHHELIETP